MKIIIAPAKRMRSDIAYIEANALPHYLTETKALLAYLRTLTVNEVQQMLGCNQRIAKQAHHAYQHMQLEEQVVPALLAYDGIQYKYMAPDIFPDEYYAYVQQHIRILSGFYGILRPFDGVVPYRLELNNPFHTSFCNSLYDFWQDKPYQELIKDRPTEIVDLASAQYSKIIKKYLDEDIHYVHCSFAEDVHGTLKEKGVYVKMARGEMVRYLAEISATSLEDVKSFHRLGYAYAPHLSDAHTFVFRREHKQG